MGARREITIIAAVLAAACSASSKSQNGESHGGNGSVTIFVTTEIKGQIEPCGCTTDPMGDLARTSALLARARSAGPVLYLDGGSLLYKEGPEAKRSEQARLKAELLTGALADRLHPDAVGLGPFDLAGGAAAVAPRRQAANIAADAGVPLEAPKILEAGGMRVGVFGVVDPALLSGSGIQASDPAAAARDAIAALRAQGAQVIVAILHMERKRAADLAEAAPGIDFGVIGAGAPEPDALRVDPQRAGTTWLVQPANRGQVLTRLDLTVSGNGRFADAIGEDRAQAEIAALDDRLARLRADIAKFEADPDADAEFVARQKADLAALQSQRDALAASPLQKPPEGSWFVMSQVKIRKTLACDSDILARKVAFDEAAGKANLAAAAGKPAPAPAPGNAGYTGVGECGYCHKKQVEFWKKTRHASAWKTLVDLGKQYDLDCVYCHATGFGAPGGSTLATLAQPPAEGALTDVQCEVCHAPASIHVDEDGKEKPSSLRHGAPRAVCIECHNEQHSDTFDYDSYLRDVTGPGHGEKLRAKLGDGPTGHELRSAALAKAGAAIGEGCPK